MSCKKSPSIQITKIPLLSQRFHLAPCPHITALPWNGGALISNLLSLQHQINQNCLESTAPIYKPLCLQNPGIKTSKKMRRWGRRCQFAGFLKSLSLLAILCKCFSPVWSILWKGRPKFSFGFLAVHLRSCKGLFMG